MKILVTGATGFIGSNLVEKLVEEGHKVKVLIREKSLRNDFGIRREILELLKKLKVVFCFGDLLNEKSLNEAIKDVEIIFHLAAIARPMAIHNELYFKTNKEGTKNLLDSCKNKGIKKIIIMSSISAVGPTKNENPVNEKSECHPEDIYGWSKLAQEKIAMEYFKKYKLPIVFLRPPMVFGPRDFEMLKLFRIISTRFFPLSCNNECMEFLYVENLVGACLLVMKNGENGEKYHIANEKHYSINEIVGAISKIKGKKILPIKFPLKIFVLGGWIMEILGKIFGFHPPFKSDTTKWMTEKCWYSDISRAKKELGFKPQITLEEGIKRTMRYYKEKDYLS